ncbi:PREDICTED: C-type lectin domain family 14 member A [Condylura cristata]|uniref:C-type lectin domain family 14 member A n=1 Tax=Condylura cristata TaxID=143302 RepID=UPI0003343E3C|nr:PREDICTED: C-type lectin domain family 14 member A [Condylura cristata]
MRPVLTLCLLCQAFWPHPGSGEHPTADRAGCSVSGACYSLHHATFKRKEADEACNLRGGALSTVRGGEELSTVLALLRAGPGPGGGSKDLLFWVALERRRSHCTLENEPLRGFSWLSPDAEADEGSESNTLQWVEEPQRSCTVRGCAGLQATGGVEPVGWKEMRCHLRANGYLCKYQFEGLCPAPHPGAASNLSYRAPFQLHSAALDFSPPGTKVSALCPGRIFATATCIADEVGARWDGIPSGAVLCPCPGRYLRAGKCAQLPDCLDDAGGFACQCAAGFVLGKDGRSCVTSEEGQPTPEDTEVPSRLPPATVSTPMPKRTLPPRVHEKLGEIPHVLGQDSAATSIPEIPQWGTQSTMSTLQIFTEAESKATVTSSVTHELNSTSSSAIPQPSDTSSTVVFILVSIAVVVLVILTMTVLGLFKLCFHKKPSSRQRKGPLAQPGGVESGGEAAALHSSSVRGTDNGVKVGYFGRGNRADPSLAASSPSAVST